MWDSGSYLQKKAGTRAEAKRGPYVPREYRAVSDEMVHGCA